MDVELSRSADFNRALGKIRGASADVRKAFNAEIKSATIPLENELKQAVRGLDSSSSRGGGGRQRERHSALRSKTGKASRKTGLRENIARGVTRKITLSGYRTGVRVRVDGKYLPEDQRSLIKATNKGLVRHPVFGNRGTWVSQRFTPKGWFDRTVQKHGPQAVSKIEAAVRNVLERLN